MANILKIFKNNNKLRADQVYYNSTTSLLEAMWPIGRGFIDFTGTDYTNWLGFKWERELVGMTAVGLDENDDDFNVIGKQVGNKHSQIEADGMRNSDTGTNWVYQGINVNSRQFSVVQPSQVVAYWKRVS